MFKHIHCRLLLTTGTSLCGGIFRLDSARVEVTDGPEHPRALRVLLREVQHDVRAWNDV